MKVYIYGAETNEFLEEREVYLDGVHREKEGENHYLIPANATVVKPNLVNKKGFAIVWDDKTWSYKEDHRGEEVWRRDSGEKVTVTWLGEVGGEYTTVEPPKPEPAPPKLEDVQAQLALLTKQLETIRGGSNESQ